MRAFLFALILAATSSAAAQSPGLLPLTRTGASGGLSQAVADARYCALVGGTGSPGCPMQAAGVTFPTAAVSSALKLQTDVGGFGSQVMTATGWLQLADDAPLWMGGGSGQLVFFPSAGLKYPIVATRSFGADDVFTLEVSPLDYGWTLYGPRVGAAQDWAALGAYQDPVDLQRGTIFFGSNNPRAGASTVPLACAASDIDGGGVPISKACFMADATLDMGLDVAGADLTLSQTGIDRADSLAVTVTGAGSDVTLTASDDLLFSHADAVLFSSGGTPTFGITASGNAFFNGDNFGGGLFSNAPVMADGGYNAMGNVGTDPPSGDCDAADEMGRHRWQSAAQELWICDGTDGWRVIATVAP